MVNQIKKDTELLQRWQCMFTAEEVSMINKLLQSQARITAYETERRVIKDAIKALKTKLELTEGSSCTCCAGDEDYFYDIQDVIKILKSLSNPKTNE